VGPAGRVRRTGPPRVASPEVGPIGSEGRYKGRLTCGAVGFKLKMKFDIKFQIGPIFVQIKTSVPEPKIFEIKYGFGGFEEMKNFLHRNYIRFETNFELKFGNSRSDLGFSKLNKIARDGLKI
jgi:hypothetical protein